MSVIARKNEKGQITYYVAFRWNGKKVWERVGGDKREAKRTNATRLREVREKTYLPAKERVATTFGQWIEGWVDRRKNRSAVADGRAIRNYVLPIKWLCAMPLADIRPPDVEHMVADLKDTRGRRVDRLGVGYVRNVYRLVHTSLREAHRKQLIPGDPCEIERDTFTYKAAEKTIYQRDEIVRLCTDERIPEAQRVLASLLFFTGTRKGEASGRTWSDWDEGARPLGALHVRDQYDGQLLKTERVKGQAPRTVPVHPLLAEVLRRWRDDGFEKTVGRPPTPVDPIVPAVGRWRTEKPLGHLGPRVIVANWTRACLRVGVPNRTVHATRHTFITMCLRGGATKPHLEKITHNSRGDILDTYTHTDWAPLCHAVACLGVDVRVDSVASVALFALPPSFSGRAHAHNAEQLPPSGIAPDPSFPRKVLPRGHVGGADGDAGHPIPPFLSPGGLGFDAADRYAHELAEAERHASPRGGR